MTAVKKYIPMISAMPLATGSTGKGTWLGQPAQRAVVLLIQGLAWRFHGISTKCNEVKPGCQWGFMEFEGNRISISFFIVVSRCLDVFGGILRGFPATETGIEVGSWTFPRMAIDDHASGTCHLWDEIHPLGDGHQLS